MSPRPARPRNLLRRHRIECLEARFNLSGDEMPPLPSDGPVPVDSPPEIYDTPEVEALTATLVDPAPDLELGASPATVTVAFNRPINPDTLGSDLFIAQLDDDGNPVDGFQIDQSSLDPAGTKLNGTLDRILAPGHYQVWIVAYSNIQDLDGNYLLPDGNYAVLGGFTVAQAGIDLEDAIDLGTPTSEEAVVSGDLDFLANPYAVSLYKITLPNGHFWRLGLEVSAQRDGGTLDSALALFDDQGRPLVSDELGRGDNPYDPYLFAGLGEGTYYVGVSGAGNRPGLDGAYDPATGSVGSIPQAQEGGAFRLHLVADPADTPASLRSLRVVQADRRDPSPTGLVLRFTGSLRLGPQMEDLPSTLDRGIEVVGDDGRTWAVTASGYNERKSRLDYLFRDRLPAGHYTVRLSSEGGLVDLAGLSPVADGEPAGVLGAFDIAPRLIPPAPRDLGPLRPSGSFAGITFNASLKPGLSSTYRFVVTVPTLYTFQWADTGAPLPVAMDGTSLRASIGGADSVASDGSNVRFLDAGTYSITIDAGPAAPSRVRLSIDSPSLPELILKNGLGQGPGLAIRLITHAPEPSRSTGGTIPSGSDDPDNRETSGSGNSAENGGSGGSSTGSNEEKPVTHPVPPDSTPDRGSSPPQGQPTGSGRPSPVVPPKEAGSTRTPPPISDPKSRQSHPPLAASPSASPTPASLPTPALGGPAGDTAAGAPSERGEDRDSTSNSAVVAIPPSGRYLGLSGDLIGRPTIPEETSSAVSPVADSGATARPSQVPGQALENRPGWLPRAQSSVGSRRPSEVGERVAPSSDEPPNAVVAGPPGAAMVQEAGMLGLDRVSWPLIDWRGVFRIGSTILDGFAVEDEPEGEAADPALVPVRAAGEERIAEGSGPSSEFADRLWVISPGCVGLGVALAARSRYLIRFWTARTRDLRGGIRIAAPSNASPGRGRRHPLARTERAGGVA